MASLLSVWNDNLHLAGVMTLRRLSTHTIVARNQLQIMWQTPISQAISFLPLLYRSSLAGPRSPSYLGSFSGISPPSFRATWFPKPPWLHPAPTVPVYVIFRFSPQREVYRERHDP
ncbi:RacA [Aspergillus luchuensis]|uniref:RacA n=1 Tax=Aspergillus kawachii TaxID=1069201 RepID=A0A146FCM2_ASPKA|nr:RacA [Aspergillus luchuensis]